MTNKVLIIIFLFSLSFFINQPVYSQTEFKSDAQLMQKPPDGMAWKWAKGMPIAFLVPDGWFFYSLGPQGTFITKENIERDHSFKTGLTFYLLNYDGVKFSSPENEMRSLIGYLKSHESKVQDQGIIKQESALSSDLYWIRYEKEMPFGPIIVQTMVFYNKSLNNIFSIIFESPKEEWAESKIIGNKITSKIFVAYGKVK